MRVELRVEARQDLLEGAWFYEQQREGLGDYFTDCLFEDLGRLEREAGIHETVFGLHRKLSKRFPFAIYYKVAERAIDVVAILDCRRDPEATAARLSGTNG
ncbi:MAG: type II toxin-antitoxin system RelE/ParE family toxin [Pirellulales bacterium]